MGRGGHIPAGKSPGGLVSLFLLALLSVPSLVYQASRYESVDGEAAAPPGACGTRLCPRPSGSEKNSYSRILLATNPASTFLQRMKRSKGPGRSHRHSSCPHTEPCPATTFHLSATYLMVAVPNTAGFVVAGAKPPAPGDEWGPRAGVRRCRGQRDEQLTDGPECAAC